MLGVETLHPLVSVVNLGEARSMQHMRHTNGFYSVMLKDEKFCDVVYGRSRYDYDRGLWFAVPLSEALTFLSICTKSANVADDVVKIDKNP